MIALLFALSLAPMNCSGVGKHSGECASSVADERVLKFIENGKPVWRRCRVTPEEYWCPRVGAPNRALKPNGAHDVSADDALRR